MRVSAPRRAQVTALSAVLLLAWPAALVAQNVPAIADEISVADVETAVARVRGAPHLAEAATEILELYDRTLAQLKLAEEWEERARGFEKTLLEAPSRLSTLREELALPATEQQPDVPPEASVAQLEQLLAQQEAELQAAQESQATVLAEQEQRSSRRSELPGKVSEASSRLETIAGELAAAPPENEETERVLARRALLLARRAALTAEIASHRQELLSYDARGELLLARQERAARQVTRADRLTKAWREVVAEKRRQDAALATEAAYAELARAANSHALVRDLAASNAELAERRTGVDGLVAKIERVTMQSELIGRELDSLRQDVARVGERVEAAALSPAIGLLLVNQRAALTDLRDRRVAISERKGEIGQLKLDLIEMKEERSRLVDVDGLVEQELQKLSPDIGQQERDLIRNALSERFTQRREFATKLQADLDTYLEKLVDLDAAEETLIHESTDFKAWIDERVLWVQVVPAMHEDTRFLDKTAGALGWVLDAPAWVALMSAAVVSSPLFAVVIPSLAVLLLLLMRPRMRARIDRAAEMTGHLRTDNFGHTLGALLMSVLIALPVPLVVWFLASLFERAAAQADQAPRAVAVAAGLRAMAMAWFLGELIWRVCRQRGVCEAHFRWPAESLKLVRRQLSWLMIIGLPAIFLWVTLGELGTVEHADSLGRIAFIVGELALAWFLFRILLPGRGVLASWLERHPGGWVDRTRWLWFLIAWAPLIALAIIMELGYGYTATQLHFRLQATMFLVLALVLLHALMMRGLSVAQRRLAVQQYIKRRAVVQAEAADADDESEIDADEPSRPAPAAAEEQEDEADIDVQAVSDQSRRLLQVVLVVTLVAASWLIWRDILPALRILDAVEISTYTVQVVNYTTPPEGGDPIPVVFPREVPVTLADVMVALIILVLTLVAARNVPGLLEITVLQRLPFKRAGRYAITAISRYLITVVGIIWAFGAVGIGWAEVQWLVAALGVGLGFGLQEIFANFVSGLIILFERPVRVGDTVTVGDVTGTVTRIHMRATTIMTWDRTELIVPNKSFITADLTNWTLSDSVLRVIVRVGIAYGSDTPKATELLYKVARENPAVLDDPPPNAVFTRFGDSTLDFELRVFVKEPETYRIIHHSLNQGIDAAFKAAGIEIAFPQRDLHLRSVHAPVELAGRLE